MNSISIVYQLLSCFFIIILLQKITVAECIETQSKAMTMLTIDQLSYLLKFALQKIKQPGVRGFFKSLYAQLRVADSTKDSGNIHEESVIHVCLFPVCLIWADWALSEACISGATSRLCRVHLPPHGLMYFREGTCI